MKTLNEFQSFILKVQGKKAGIVKLLTDLSSTQAILLLNTNYLDKAQVLLQKVAQDTQNQLKFHISEVVQLALDAVFPGECKFCLDFEMKRGRTEARMYLLDKFGGENDPTEEDGGGLVDIISFALRFAAWSLSKTARVILMDEPFKMVSKDKIDQALRIVHQLSRKLKIQIIMVSHLEEVSTIADRLFYTDKDENGVSHVSMRKVEND